MKGPGSGGSAGQGHVRYRAFAQVATGCVTPKKTPQASETRDVRTTAELNLPFNSAGAAKYAQISPTASFSPLGLQSLTCQKLICSLLGPRQLNVIEPMISKRARGPLRQTG